MIKGEESLFIKENMKYNSDNQWSSDHIDRVYKTEKSLKRDLCNVIFRAIFSNSNLKNVDSSDFKDKKEYIKAAESALKEKNITINGFDIWIKSRDRNDLENLIFDPKHYYNQNCNSIPVYNLFNGLNIEKSDTFFNPKLNIRRKTLSEDSPFFNHIKNIWCKGDTKSYEYTLNWFASIIKKPWKKLRSALVLKSTERAGKGLIIDKIKEILGDMYVFHPSSPKDILGDYNVGCRNKLLIFMDELVWGGDKERAGVFKKLISEKKISINAKFKSIYDIDNLANIVIASNENWVVPAGTTDTRWVVLELDNSLAICNKTEKKRIVSEILNTDIYELAKFFYERDIENWDSDDIPITDALRDQRINSMSTVNRWWFNSLNTGYFTYENNKKIFNNKDNSVIYRKFIYDSYIEHSKDRHTISASLFKKIKNFVGELKQTRRSIEGKRIYCIVIPKLEICQNLWRNLYRDQNWKFDYQDITDSDSDSDSDSEGNVISI